MVWAQVIMVLAQVNLKVAIQVKIKADVGRFSVHKLGGNCNAL